MTFLPLSKDSLCIFISNIANPPRFGLAGGETSISGLCVLPLNMINQKFYMLFWFWLSILITASFFMLTVRLILVASTDARSMRIKYFYGVRNVEVRLSNSYLLRYQDLR